MSDLIEPPTPSVVRSAGGAVRTAVLIVVLFAVVGAVAGFVWESLWTAPEGVAFDGRFVAVGQDAFRQFSGDGLFVLMSAGIGVALGGLCAWFGRRDELVTLAGVFLGAVLGSLVMGWVGSLLGPPDPGPLAANAADGTPLIGHLKLASWGAHLAMPAGSAFAMSVVFLVFSPRPRSQV